MKFLTKKDLKTLLKRGFNICTKIENNKYALKQIPKINGGIVVMDHLRKVLVVVLVLKTVSLMGFTGVKTTWFSI